MKILETLEPRVLKGFQDFSDRIQDRTGITCLSIAKFLFTTYLAVFPCCLIAKLRTTDTIGLLIYGRFYVLMMVVGGGILRISGGSVSNPLFKNKLELMLEKVRRLLLWFVPLMLSFSLAAIISREKPASADRSLEILGEACFSVALVSFGCFIYFASCTPKPPSKSRLKKALESASAIFAQKPALSPG